MAINKKTVRELKKLLRKLDAFSKDLPHLRNTLSRHIGQAKKKPSGW